MKLGAVRSPNYEHLEGIVSDEEAGPLFRSRVKVARETSKTSNVSTILLIFVIISMVALVTFGFSSRSAFFHGKLDPMLTMEQSKGLEFLTAIESKKQHIFSNMSPEDIALLFEGYIAKYSKNFKDDTEKLARLDIFKKNLVKIDENNEDNVASGGNVVHGLTKFADMTFEEFQSSFLTASKRPTALSITHAHVSSFNGDSDGGLVDWSGIYTTPVDDQGLCGACKYKSLINFSSVQAFHIFLHRLGVLSYQSS
jgi:hypothetical protein